MNINLIPGALAAAEKILKSKIKEPQKIAKIISVHCGYEVRTAARIIKEKELERKRYQRNTKHEAIPRKPYKFVRYRLP